MQVLTTWSILVFLPKEGMLANHKELLAKLNGLNRLTMLRECKLQGLRERITSTHLCFKPLFEFSRLKSLRNSDPSYDCNWC